MRIILNSCLIALGADKVSAASDYNSYGEFVEPSTDDSGDDMPGVMVSKFKPVKNLCYGAKTWENNPKLGENMHFSDFHNNKIPYDPLKQFNLNQCHAETDYELDVMIKTDEGWVYYYPHLYNKYGIIKGEEPSIEFIQTQIREETLRMHNGRGTDLQFMNRKEKPRFLFRGKTYRLRYERLYRFEQLATFTFDPQNPEQSKLLDSVTVKKRIVQTVDEQDYSWDEKVSVDLKKSGKIQFRTYIASNVAHKNWWIVERCENVDCQGHNWPVINVEGPLLDELSESDRTKMWPAPYINTQIYKNKNGSTFTESMNTQIYQNKKGRQVHPLDIALKTERYTEFGQDKFFFLDTLQRAERRRRRRLLESLYR